MKSFALGLGICGIFSLSFLLILASANEAGQKSTPAKAYQEVNMGEKTGAVTGNEAAGPESLQGQAHFQSEMEEGKYFSDDKKFIFSASMCGNGEQLFLGLEGQKDSRVLFEIFDMSGKCVFSHRDLVLQGSNQYLMSMKYATPGIYLVRATVNGVSIVTKVARQNA